MADLRNRRRLRGTDELLGEHGQVNEAVRWGALESHPFIQKIVGWVKGDLEPRVTTVQTAAEAAATSASSAASAASAAQADATAAASNATQALADAAAAQAAASAVAADLLGNYYTITQLDVTFGNYDDSAAVDAKLTALQAAIENPAGSSLGATLATGYYTIAQADSAIAVASTTLKAEIEDPGGTSIGADLATNYYTAASADAAIAAAISTYDAGAANVTSIQQAITETDGFATAFAGLTATVDGSGDISGFKATTWADPDGSGGGVLELLGDVIVPGTLAANKLTVGLQANSFINSDFTAPLTPHWVTKEANGGAGAATTLTINAAGQSYAWNSFPTLSAYQNDGSTTGYYDFCCKPVVDISATLAPGWAVTAGERVSFSARVSAHRCTGSIYIEWYDGTGTLLGTTDDAGDPGYVGGNLSTASAGPVGSDTNPDLWDELWILADAPAGAGYYLPVFRAGPSGSGDADSEMFVARPMHCRVHGNASTPTPYSPEGTTLIDGDRILTGSVTADKITVASLSALGLTVGAADIEDASIGSAKLEGTIQSDNYVAGVSGWVIYKNGDAEFNSLFVRTDQLEANAVTALESASDATTTIADGTTQTCVERAVSGVGVALVFCTVNVRTNNLNGVNWNSYRFWLERNGVRISEYFQGYYDAEKDSRFFYAHNPHNVTLIAASATYSGTYRLRCQAGWTGESGGDSIVAEDAELTVLNLKR
jgi:hypothetical protein